MALGKCISIENTTAILEDCDGSSKVCWADVFFFIVGTVHGTDITDKGKV